MVMGLLLLSVSPPFGGGVKNKLQAGVSEKRAAQEEQEPLF